MGNLDLFPSLLQQEILFVLTDPGDFVVVILTNLEQPLASTAQPPFSSA